MPKTESQPKPRKASFKRSKTSLSPAQTSLYWREWAKARKSLIENQFLSPEEADQERAQITVETLGRPVSSKALSNGQLDKMLASFRALSRPEDPDAQIDAMDQPEKRHRWKVDQLVQAMNLTPAYLDKLCLNVVGCEYQHCSVIDLKKILAALTYHQKRQRTNQLTPHESN